MVFGEDDKDHARKESVLGTDYNDSELATTGRHRCAPLGVRRGVPLYCCEVQVLQFLRDWTGFTVTDFAIVEFAHRRDVSCCTS